MTIFGLEVNWKGRGRRWGRGRRRNGMGYKHGFRGGRDSCDRENPEGLMTLAQAPTGAEVRVVGFAPCLAIDRRHQLEAYGVNPGHSLVVLQQRPVTVVQIEHLELALEPALAALVTVTV